MHHGDPKKKTSEDIRPFLPKLTNICSTAGEQLAGSARASAARGVSSHRPWIHGPHGPHGPPWLRWPNTMAGWNPKVGPSLKRREDLLHLLSWIRLKRPISVPTLKGPQFLHTCTQEIGLEICQATSKLIAAFNPSQKMLGSLTWITPRKDGTSNKHLNHLNTNQAMKFQICHCWMLLVRCPWFNLRKAVSSAVKLEIAVS